MVTAKPTAMTAVTTSLQDFDDGAQSKAGHYLTDSSAAGTRGSPH
jgi:hypothetical protein